jgi:hypothetical protein
MVRPLLSYEMPESGLWSGRLGQWSARSPKLNRELGAESQVENFKFQRRQKFF